MGKSSKWELYLEWWISFKKAYGQRFLERVIWARLWIVLNIRILVFVVWALEVLEDFDLGSDIIEVILWYRIKLKEGLQRRGEKIARKNRVIVLRWQAGYSNPLLPNRIHVKWYKENTSIKAVENKEEYWQWNRIFWDISER